MCCSREAEKITDLAYVAALSEEGFSLHWLKVGCYVQVSYLFRFRLDNLRNAASADTKLSSALKEKDIKIAEMESRYWKRQSVNYWSRLPFFRLVWLKIVQVSRKTCQTASALIISRIFCSASNNFDRADSYFCSLKDWSLCQPRFQVSHLTLGTRLELNKCGDMFCHVCEIQIIPSRSNVQNAITWFLVFFFKE